MEPVFIVLAAAGTAISIAGISVQAIKLIYHPDSKGNKKGSVDPNNYYSNNELNQLNKLYCCNQCDRYARKHMLELDLLKRHLESGETNLKEICPNCSSEYIYPAKEEYSWQENHRHCFKLKPDQYSEYKNDVQKWRNAIKQAEELKAFEEYERKHLANGPKREEDKSEVFMTIHNGLRGITIPALKTRLETDWQVRDTVKAEINRAFEKKSYEEYEKGGVTLEEAVESLRVFQESCKKIGE